MPNSISFFAFHFSWSLIIAQYHDTLCVADLYQVNRTRTLCYSDIAQFLCSKTSTTILTWSVISSTSGRVKFLSFNTRFDSVGMVDTTILDASTVTAQLLNNDTSSLESLLTISANLSATIECNNEITHYHSENSKQVKVINVPYSIFNSIIYYRV